MKAEISVSVAYNTEGKELVCLTVDNTQILIDKNETLLLISGLASAASDLEGPEHYPDMRLM